MAEISAELLTIVNGRYGSDIRMAIHDAIQKINVSSGSGGGGVSHGPVGDMKHVLGGYDDLITTGFVNCRTRNPIEYVEESSASLRSSATLSMSVLGEHTVLGLIFYTGQNLSITGIGSAWQLVSDQLIYVASSGGTNHKVNVAIVKRVARYEEVSLAVSIPTSEYIGLKLVLLNQNEGVSGTPEVTEIDSSSYLVQSGAASDTIYITVAYDDYNPTYTAYSEDSIVSMTNRQFGAFYKPGGGAGIRFDYSNSASSFPEDGTGLVTVTLN